MKKYIVSIGLILAALGTAQPASAQPANKIGAKGSPASTRLSPDQAADRQVWMDEHARWNAEHMSLARRLEKIAAALKQNGTGFDLHGDEVRAFGNQGVSMEALVSQRPRLRTAHEEARNVHNDMVDTVNLLERAMRKNLGQNQSFQPADELP